MARSTSRLAAARRIGATLATPPDACYGPYRFLTVRLQALCGRRRVAASRLVTLQARSPRILPSGSSAPNGSAVTRLRRGDGFATRAVTVLPTAHTGPYREGGAPEAA